MSSNDPLPESFQEYPNPEAEDLDALPAEAVPPTAYPPLRQEARITVRPRKPHPGLGFALLWMLLFIIISQGAAVAVAIVLLLAQIFLSPDREAFLKRMSDPDFQNSAEFGRILLPAFLVAEVVSIVLGWLVLRLVAGRDWTRKVALRRPGWVHVGLALLIFPAVVLVGEGMGELAQKLNVPHLVDLGKFMEQVGTWPWWLAVLIIGFGPGVGEELWCRGFLGRGLVGHYGLVLGILFTSVLFGLMHIEPMQIIYAPVIGAVLHYVYWTTRSLWLSMLLHAFNNSLSVLAASKNAPLHWVFERLDQSADKAAHPELIYVGAVLLLIAVGYALYQCRARLELVEPDLPAWQPAYPGVEYPPPDSGTRVVHPAPSAAALAAALGGFLAFLALWLTAVG
jgi:membrane protease YdiL (CAAX protease family)